VTFSKNYDKKYLKQENDKLNNPINITFFEQAMNEFFAETLTGYNGVCGFVNDDFSKPVIEKLKANGINLIALRCAGFDNVDLKACKEIGV